MKFFAQRQESGSWTTPVIVYQPEDWEYYGSITFDIGPWEIGFRWDTNKQ